MSTPSRLAPSLDLGQLWQATRKLLERLVTALDRDSFLDECLDAVVELLGADRGLIVLTDSDGISHSVNARGQNRALTSFEREEVSKTIIHQARESGKAVVWDPLNATGVVESIADLGILVAIAVPLRSFVWRSSTPGEAGKLIETRGVLYVDFRNPRKLVGDLHREFIEAAAVLVAAVLQQNEELLRTRERLREAEAHGGERAVPSLHELLSPRSMDRVRREVMSCLRGTSSILVLGESGTGKTLLAEAVAIASDRGPVVRAVLGSSDDLNTITSELFGHERGAYSGATTKRSGTVEHAHGGTLILDEILNLPPHAQQLLLDFTQFGTFRPLGYEQREPKRVDVRIIAATNGDLPAAIRAGKFRQDLYFRLAAVTLNLPPLRDRREDIPMMAEGILARTDKSRRWRISLPLRRLLLSEELDWPGNVRQLEGFIRRLRERALARDPDTDTITPDDVEPHDLGRTSLAVPPPAAIRDPSEPLCSQFQVEPEELGDSWRRLRGEREKLEEFERQIIELALQKHAGVVAYAARELEVPRTSLKSRIETLGIERPNK